MEKTEVQKYKLDVVFIKSNKKFRQMKLQTSEDKNDAREEICVAIGRFFYLVATPFNLAQSPYFSKMIEIIGKYGGQGLRIPSGRDELQASF